MKVAHLRLVADNTERPADNGRPDPGAAKAKALADFEALAVRARYWFALALMILGAPFRFVAAVARFAVAAGRAFFDAIFKIVIGTIGLALIVIVGYGLLRVVLHPLFH